MSKGKVAIACVMVLALVATLCFGCAEEKEQKVTIIIGNLTDMTGVAASALVPIQLSLDAHVKYINEEEPIPGVELKTIRYDTRYDPARFIPGYEWLKERGAEVIFTEIPEMAETLRSFADKDKIPVVCAVATRPMYDPPGWVFCLNQDATHMAFTVMKWIGDQWEAEGKPGKPKIGTAGWSSPYGNAVRDGAEYCLDHPDKFDYVGSYMAPTGTVTWTGEVAALKDCDYVVLTTPGALQPSTFAAEFRSKGYTAKFVGLDSLSAYWDYMLDTIGSEELDGALIGQTWPLWVHPAPIVQYLKDLAYENYPADKADSLIYGNCGWISGGSQTYLLVECLREAIEAVGAENFSSQAFYDTAENFTPDLPGFEEMGWTPTERRIYRYIGMYEYSYAVGDFVVLQDWVRAIESKD
jgi:ABC-type branched-subunit amino acid transport system substrate-binding protein